MKNESKNSATSLYESRLAVALKHLNHLEPLSRRISWFRLATFVLATPAFFVRAWLDGMVSYLAGPIGVVAAVGFVALVVWHRRVIRQIDNWKNVSTICKEGLARIDRRWEELQEIPEPMVENGVSADLDILGRASLYRLTGGAYTNRGQYMLANWLLAPADPTEIADRQELVLALRGQTDVLLDMRLLTQGLDRKPSDPEPFLAWAEGSPWLQKHPLVLWTARVLGLLPIILGLCSVFGWIQAPLWLLAMIVNLGFTGLFASRIHRIFDAVSVHKGRMEHYSSLFRFVSRLRLNQRRGRTIQESLATDGLTAHRQTRKLERISSFADLRFSAMTYLPIQMLTLLDFHVLWRLEKWQSKVGSHARRWLEALGEFEALVGLATLSHDNPDYTFPEVSDAAPPRFSARGLGHPLLPPSTCVINDVDLGEPGTFLLVTGSNMSGKSSLLRSIGLNAALAGAGGAVHATALSTAPFVLGTSFRVADSISDGVSFFMAELMRLKQIITQAEERASSEPSLLFLLDEILQGTNIVERRIAVVGVLHHLIHLGCLGAVSSHDLTLANADELTEFAQTVYFTEHFLDGENKREMHFDYILRSGLAPTTNALELLRLMGLSFD
ncbi:MAG: hypothetical protein GY854_08395 [Deltaproteobacteria bacterium]|nr:hypothetical protein [Deltaproteobacteria bacterium]